VALIERVKRDGVEAWVTLRNREGERLGFQRVEPPEDCPVDISTTEREIIVHWDCSERTDLCNVPLETTATARIEGGALKVNEETAGTMWTDRCGE
jgi:hypothetical protein